MKFTWFVKIVLAVIVTFGAATYSYAGSDRWIMVMTTARMDKAHLVFVRFFGPDGVALESAALEKMVIREQDCSTGHIFEMVKDYKMGYAPKNMMVGIYLSPFVWYKKSLCFSVPGMGKIEQSLDPSVGKSRIFQLKIVP